MDFKKILKVISDVLLALVLIVAFLFYGMRILGFTPYTVLSGSMERVYPTGSIIYVRDVEPETLDINDVITFKMKNGVVATHRIVGFVEDEKNRNIIYFQTKGDENEVVDGNLVKYEDVIGKPVFHIPYLGYVATFIIQPIGRIVAILVGIALVLVEIIIGMILDDEKDKKEKRERTVWKRQRL